MKEIQRLLRLPEIRKEYKLRHFRRLLQVLGDPQEGLRAIHVAGTNGKGSTCAMVAEGLRLAGHRVGLYTSPHLDRLTERIRIDGEEIPEAVLERLLRRVREASERHAIPTTFFEYLTAAAYLQFLEAGVDYAVLETGMGGRLDCTNLCRPVVTAITNVSRDHRQWLGDSVEEIAAEKAGIIKAGVPLFTNATAAAAERIQNIFEDINSKNSYSGIYFPDAEFFELGLEGAFQQENARLAAAILRHLGVEEATVRQALRETRWPGRLDLVQPGLLLDVAHNEAAMEALLPEIRKRKAGRVILVLGIMRDKEIAEMCRILAPVADEVIATRPAWDRAAAPEEIARQFPEAKVIPDVGEAVAAARSRAGGLVVVTGSIFTVSEARRSLGP